MIEAIISLGAFLFGFIFCWVMLAEKVPVYNVMEDPDLKDLATMGDKTDYSKISQEELFRKIWHLKLKFNDADLIAQSLRIQIDALENLHAKREENKPQVH